MIPGNSKVGVKWVKEGSKPEQCVNAQLFTVSKWDWIPMGPLGDCIQPFRVVPTPGARKLGIYPQFLNGSFFQGH